MIQLNLKRFMKAFAVTMALSSLWAGQASATDFTISATVQEVIGDAGGTNFANAANSTAGRGLPTALGGWPNGPGFAPDPSFGNNLGISGFKNDGATLTVSLNAATFVRFSWAGKGDSTLLNAFQVDSGAGFQTLWGPYPPAGPSFFDIFLPAGPIQFRWITGNSVVVANGSNLNHANSPGFFAGIDPYVATGTFQTTGDAVYLGLTDLPGTGDHDYQDLGVRLAAVPEPATIVLLGAVGAGFAGYQWVRHRRSRQRRTVKK